MQICRKITKKKEKPVFEPPKSGISVKAHIQGDFILRFH